MGADLRRAASPNESDVDDTSWLIVYGVLLGGLVVAWALGVGAGRPARRSR